MTPSAAADVIEQRIATQWAAGPNTPIAWANVPFTPPATGSWLKVAFLWANGQALTKGTASGVNHIPGILQLAVFAPKDTGDGAVDLLAESARAIFNRLRLASPSEDVMFRAVSGPVRQLEESWRSLILSAPFLVQETVT